MSAAHITNHLDRKQGDTVNIKANGAGQGDMQTTVHKHRTNRLARWAMITALFISPAWALAQSDLVMTGVGSTTPRVNTLGGYITVSDTIKNQGATTSTVSVRVGYYLSTDNVITTTDTLLGYRNVGTIAAGASNANAGYAYYATVPANMAPGTYYVGAIADYSGLEAETDETNNALVAATTLEITHPDLVMTAVGTTTPKVNTLGGYITVSDTVKNQGLVASTTTMRVGYYLSTDNVITTADTFLGYRNVGTIAAGVSNANAGYAYYATVPANMAPGVYYLGAIADYSGLQTETDESNNGLAGAGATVEVTHPDLVMTAVGTTATRVNTQGGSITVSDTIKNQGLVASTATMRVGYYLSTDNVITTADTFLGYRNVGTIAVGASNSTASAYANVPAGMVPGTYYLGAIADYSGLQTETDETNNGLAGAGATIEVTHPDLIMTAVGSTTTNAAPGGYLNVSDTLKNQGLVSSTITVQVGYYLSSDDVITTTDTFLGYRNVGTIAAGASNANAGAAYATVPANMAPGTYYLGAIADRSGLQAETDESNNALTATGTMIAIGPDLVMTGITTASTSALPGSSITLADTYKNRGASATGTGCRQVGYYLSADAVITAADTLIGSRQHCGALAANGSNSGTATTATIPANLAIGTYYLGAIADNTNTETEADDNNNSLTGAPLLLTLLSDPPTNVSATGGNASATVSFTAPAGNGGAAITGYTVTSNPAGGVDSHAGTTALSHLVTGLANGTAYTFTVTASNGAGSSIASAPSNSVTPATVPGAPVIGTATASHTQASVSFTAPTDNGGAAISGYTATATPGGQSGTCAASPCTVTGLTNGTAYTLTVTAGNSAGTGPASAPSNSVTPSVMVPGAPQNVIATGGVTQATVSFSAPLNNGGAPVTGYTVISSPAGLTDSNAGSLNLSHLITGLVSGTTYSFTVTATNVAGTSLPSAPSNSVTAGANVGQAYYIYADHLDTPRQITDANGNLVWDWQNSDPFGNNPPNENPNGAGQFSFNLRFPGQYADKETNTYYNINRDYDPAIGRYVESDPIGLAGGINTFTYVRGNPVSRRDPAGLEDWGDFFQGLGGDYLTTQTYKAYDERKNGPSVCDNMKEAKARYNALWFYNQIRNKGQWDYKQRGPEYEDFGNFNFGATGYAFGFSESILLRGAGWAQSHAGTSKPEWGSWWWKAPYGDDPNDQAQIKMGIEFAKSGDCGCQK